MLWKIVFSKIILNEISQVLETCHSLIKGEV
jgi:hypothetical protein